MSALLSFLVTSLLSIISRLATAAVADAVMQRVLIHLIEWAVKSTATVVDDEIAAPILKALREP